jgi:hypothetical protein
LARTTSTSPLGFLITGQEACKASACDIGYQSDDTSIVTMLNISPPSPGAQSDENSTYSPKETYFVIPATLPSDLVNIPGLGNIMYL